MKKISKTLVFFGSGPVAARSLEFLSSHFSVEAVITKPKPSHHKGSAPVEELSKALGIKTLFASTKDSLDEIINRYQFDSNLGVVIDYGVIFSSKVINSFSLGIINSHFSLLPQWRGADPITFSILSGQPKTGVSLMIIEPQLDTGKLIAQKSVHIQKNETTSSLTQRLIQLSNAMLDTNLPLYISGKLKPRSQPHPDRATYSRKLVKDDGIIDWSKPAKDIEREIRAFIGWPASKSELLNRTVIITKAHVSSHKDNALSIKCGDGLYLTIDTLIAPSGKTMDAKSFINGYSVG
jgi:methionyl-tRNA formyltransferase